MARDIPAWIETAVREKRAGAWDVFFGLHSIDLVFNFVAFVGNGEKADTMNRGVGRANPGNGKAQVVPGEVHRIGDKEKGRESSEQRGESSVRPEKNGRSV
jgi:hypothetical protein